MRTSRAVAWLAFLIVVLALVAAGAGLFLPGGDGPFTITTVRGETAVVYGQGLYRYDSLFRGAGFRGTDAVTLVLAIPLLVVVTLLYRRGSLRGGLLLTGTLGFFLYNYASLALGAAYSSLFLAYVALFGASLFAFVLAFRSIVAQSASSRFSAPLPRRGIAVFMLASGMLTSVVWLGPLVGALVRGRPPALLDHYTTMVTDVLDLGIIVPSTFLSGVLMLRRNPLGYLIAFPLLVILVILGPAIVGQTVSQVSAGVSLTTGEIVGPVSGFILFGLISLWIIVVLLRDIAASEAAR